MPQRGAGASIPVAASQCTHATFPCEVVLYFDADDMRAVPERLRELSAAAEAAGFDFHSAKAEIGSEPDTGEDGWTGYAPLPEPPADTP